MSVVNAWMPITDPAELRRLGKLGEELNELASVASRCIIQGIDEIDPSTGKTNRLRMEEEIADVYAQISLTIEKFGLGHMFIATRMAKKTADMAEWERLCAAKVSA